MSAPRRRILNVAMNESLLKTRSAILEGAGYEVMSALNLLDIKTACETGKVFDLVIIGYAIPSGGKRQAMFTIRQYCGQTPILELYPHGATPALEEADELLPSSGEGDTLLAKVSEILAKKRKKARVAS